MSETVKIRVPGKAEYMQTVRIAMQSIASQAGFDLDKSDDICVSTVEACKIVCCHEHLGFSNYYDITAEILMNSESAGGAEKSAESAVAAKNAGRAKEAAGESVTTKEAADGKATGIRITVVDSHDHDLQKLHKPCLLCPGDGDLALDVMRSLMDRVEFGADSEGNRRVVLEKMA